MVDLLWILTALVSAFIGFAIGRYQKYEVAERRAVEQVKHEEFMRKQRELKNARRSYMPRDDAGRSAVVHRINPPRAPGRR